MSLEQRFLCLPHPGINLEPPRSSFLGLLGASRFLPPSRCSLEPPQAPSAALQVPRDSQGPLWPPRRLQPPPGTGSRRFQPRRPLGDGWSSLLAAPPLGKRPQAWHTGPRARRDSEVSC